MRHTKAGLIIIYEEKYIYFLWNCSVLYWSYVPQNRSIRRPKFSV